MQKTEGDMAKRGGKDGKYSLTGNCQHSRLHMERDSYSFEIMKEKYHLWGKLKKEILKFQTFW